MSVQVYTYEQWKRLKFDVFNTPLSSKLSSRVIKYVIKSIYQEKTHLRCGKGGGYAPIWWTDSVSLNPPVYHKIGSCARKCNEIPYICNEIQFLRGYTLKKTIKRGVLLPSILVWKKILMCFWYGIHDDRKRRCRINRLHFRLKSAGFTAEPERNVLSGCRFFMQIHGFSAAFRFPNECTSLFYDTFSHEFLLSWHSTTVLFR